MSDDPADSFKRSFKPGPPQKAPTMKSRITRVEIVLSEGPDAPPAPELWTYALYDQTNRFRFSGHARTLADAGAEAAEYTRQVEQGVIVL